MQLMDGFFGRKERRWFENAATGMRHGKFSGHAVSGGQPLRVLGTTVSREGVVFVSHAQIRETDLSFTFTLRERHIPSRVRVEREETMQATERLVHRYFCSFSAIAADDWDAVVRYVDNAPEPPVAMPPAKVAADEDFRALPSAVQHKIVTQLVKMKRLAPPAAGTVPLIRLRAGTIRELSGGRTVQDVAIHSRIRVGEETRGYDTRFRVYSDSLVEPLTA